MTEKIIEIEAETLEEAREQVKSQIPEGLHVLSEQVISDGKSKTVKAVADTIESAFTKAQSEIPINAVIVEKKELTLPAQKAMAVDAFDEQSARMQAAIQIGKTETIKTLRLAMAGKKGFLGIGKKPNQYQVEVFQQAVVEVTCKAKAKILATIGEKPVTTIFGFFLRADGKDYSLVLPTATNEKWTSGLRKIENIPDAKVITFEQGDWGAPTLNSIDTAVLQRNYPAVRKAIQKALQLQGVPLTALDSITEDMSVIPNPGTGLAVFIVKYSGKLITLSPTNETKESNS